MVIRSAALALLGAAAFGVAAAPATAAIMDPVGDFLDVYAGPDAPDLDVLSVDARIVAPGTVRLSADLAGPVGTTGGAAYVWGIDRGDGTEDLAAVTPSVGAGITFDAVAVLFADATGFVLDLRTGGAPTPAFLAPGAVEVNGATLSAVLTEALLPSQGFDFADYRYNLWPRFAPDGVDPGNNTQISDLAPDASTFVAAAIPLPPALAMSMVALASLTTVARRRRSARR